MIPKIIKYYLNPHKNILFDIINDNKFYFNKNKFKIHKIKIGPFDKKTDLYFIIENFKQQIIFNTQIENEEINYKFYNKKKMVNKKSLYYTIIKFSDDFIIDNDINLKIKSSRNEFNLWLNFFYITLENYFNIMNNIFDSNIILKNNDIYKVENENKANSNILELNE